MVGSVLKAERRMGVKPGHFIVHRCTYHLVAGRAFFGSDETIARRTAERTVVGMEADHIEAADQAHMFFIFHLASSAGPPYRPIVINLQRGAVHPLQLKV